jgi:cell division protein FtsW
MAFQMPLRLWQQARPGCSWRRRAAVAGAGAARRPFGEWRAALDPLGPINLQPSELMKLFAVLYAADYTVRKLDDMGSFAAASCRWRW